MTTKWSDYRALRQWLLLALVPIAYGYGSSFLLLMTPGQNLTMVYAMAYIELSEQSETIVSTSSNLIVRKLAES